MTSGQYSQVIQLSGISLPGQATNRIQLYQELFIPSLVVEVKYTKARQVAH